MSLPRLMLGCTAVLSFAVPAHAQSMPGMDHSAMPGTPKPPEAVVKPEAEKAAPACPPEHAKMGHCSPATDERGLEAPAPASMPEHGSGDAAMPGAAMGTTSPKSDAIDPDCPPEHAKMGHCTPKVPPAAQANAPRAATGTDLEPGNAPAPTPPSDWYADRIFTKEEMERARQKMMKASGGVSVQYIAFDLAEYVVHKNKNSYRWDGEAWFGGDINRFVFKYEGEGEFRGPLDDLELFGLYSRAISPYWNLQAGIRYDVKPDPSRTYAVVAIEGLAPYWFEVTAAAFLSNKGELRGRIEGFYDQRITQRLILQPRLEANLSAQTITELGVGSGLSNLELGVRLRYEIKKEFAPYIGFEWIQQFGESARYTRANGGLVSDPH
ncbi:MAG: copper resistance protein B, partial [Novosphingobium sp.]|nr:copper resistance protein B [Novosphingobium sp.]